MKAPFIKRVLAYMIDFMIIFLVSFFITSFIPIDQQASQASKESEILTQDFYDQKIEIKEYYDSSVELNYILAKNTVLVTIASICIYILYFVVFQAYNNGQTLGKKFANIRVKSNSGKPLNTNMLLIRSLIIYGIAINIINLIFILLLKKPTYLSASNILNLIQNMLLFIIIIMMIARKDGRGLHDLIANTIVVDEKEK